MRIWLFIAGLCAALASAPAAAATREVNVDVARATKLYGTARLPAFEGWEWRSGLAYDPKP